MESFTPAQSRVASARLMVAAAFVSAALAGCGTPKAVTSTPQSYAFWPQAPAEPRVQFLRSYALTTDINSAEQGGFDKLVFGAESEKSVAINKPYGVALHGGRIYVCDIRSRGVTVLDVEKSQARLMGVTGLNRLQQPVDVAVSSDGMIYVADKTRGIAVFDPQERFTTVFGGKDLQPVSLAVHEERLYVCNMAGQNVVILDRRGGRPLGTIGTVGDQDGQFRLPLGIDVDQEGNIHVVDIMRCRLQKFSPDGKLLKAAGEMTDTAGNFVRPKHVTVDQNGYIYVVDAAFQNVQIFDPEYRLLTSFGAAGTHPGSMDLPAGICAVGGLVEPLAKLVHPAFEGRTLVAVTNQFGPNKVALYAVGQLRPTKTVADISGSQVPMGGGTRETGEPSVLGDLGTQALDENAPGVSAQSP